MGALIGSYVAFIIMELIVALPVYYILRAIKKRNHIEAVALIASIVALGAGWVAGYRFTESLMVSDYLVTSKQNEISNHGVNLTQEKWLSLRSDFLANPDNTLMFHVGAAKAALPSVIFVAIILFWLAEREKKKMLANNSDARDT